MLRNREELKDRIESRRHELQSRIAELKADARSDSRQEIDRLQRKLGEIERDLQAGWERLSEEAAARLNRLLEN